MQFVIDLFEKRDVFAQIISKKVQKNRHHHCPDIVKKYQYILCDECIESEYILHGNPLLHNDLFFIISVILALKRSMFNVIGIVQFLFNPVYHPI